MHVPSAFQRSPWRPLSQTLVKMFRGAFRGPHRATVQTGPLISSFPLQPHYTVFRRPTPSCGPHHTVFFSYAPAQSEGAMRRLLPERPAALVPAGFVDWEAVDA